VHAFLVQNSNNKKPYNVYKKIFKLQLEERSFANDVKMNLPAMECDEKNMVTLSGGDIDLHLELLKRCVPLTWMCDHNFCKVK
jgi:hypothetical protein